MVSKSELIIWLIETRIYAVRAGQIISRLID